MVKTHLHYHFFTSSVPQLSIVLFVYLNYLSLCMKTHLNSSLAKYLFPIDNMCV